MQPLVKDALENIWSIPDPDSQVILAPGRITADGGVNRTTLVGWTQVAPPSTSSRWHYFQIGQIHPLLINLLSDDSGWVLFSEACNQRQLICNIYNSYGISLPLTRTYYRRISDKNVIIAVEKNSSLDYAFDTDAIYVRIYRNQYFQSSYSTESTKIVVSGGLMSSSDDIIALHAEVLAITDATDYKNGLICYVNGQVRSEISVATTAVGDVAEYVYDASIYKLTTVNISDLQSFTSTVDSKSKWLIHDPTDWDGYIDHVFNVDLYLYDTGTDKGVYVHKNAADTLRMVTFRDYSVVTSYVKAYYDKFVSATTGNLDTSTLCLKVYVREDSYPQEPTDEVNKTKYLLKMTSAQQLAAMVGVDSSNSAWRAANLEASAYNTLMSAKREAVTLAAAEAAYGYSYANKLLCTNVIDTFTAASDTGTLTHATVPTGFRYGATAYEYSTDGLLLGFYNVDSGVGDYVCTNSEAAMVEFIAGAGGTTLDETTDLSMTVASGYNFRCYSKESGSWVDVTSGTDYTQDTSSYLVSWNESSTSKRLIRTDKKHLAYTVNLTPSDGVLIHSLTYTQDSTSVLLPVPLGEYDFWLNGHPLVEGIDYFVNFPKVQIVSKEYLIDAPGTQVLTVRCFGLCQSDLTTQRVVESGYVFDGDLSVNAIFDLHENKALRVVAGGKLIPASKQSFVEAVSSGVLTNGDPYEIRELSNSMNGLIDLDPYAWRKENIAIEKTVSQYLTIKVDATTASSINAITDKYTLYSPFLCKIIYALRNGTISSTLVSSTYTDDALIAAVSAYTSLLDGDPIKATNTPDLTYCVIHPHWLDTAITLTADQYRFLANVVRLYAKNKVVLSTLIAVSG